MDRSVFSIKCNQGFTSIPIVFFHASARQFIPTFAILSTTYLIWSLKYEEIVGLIHGGPQGWSGPFSPRRRSGILPGRQLLISKRMTTIESALILRQLIDPTSATGTSL